MIIFKDKVSGDEMFADTFKYEVIEDGQVYKIAGKMTTETTDIDDRMIGGNKSAEGADEGEGADASAVSGINVILANRLVETGFKKKDFQAYVKTFMGNVLKKMTEDGAPDDDVTKFKKGCASFVKKILEDFKEFQFFTGESMDADGGLAYVRWEDETPYIYFFKAALEEEKV